VGNVASSPGAIITPPQGGGAVQGIGEKFSPDLFTGTGNLTVPLSLPPGRNGFAPKLSLDYSTGGSNGPFGHCWAIGVSAISRKTFDGTPLYSVATDTFILSGFEDLVPLDDADSPMRQYRPRTEGAYAKIFHRVAENDDYWEVKSRDGFVSLYGTPGNRGDDSAVVADPADESQSRIFSWRLTRTTDPFGNVIRYDYERDALNVSDPHFWDQVYLSSIRYADFGADRLNPQFLATVRFIYEDRPDPFSEYRAGFEIRTVRRCSQIDILAGEDGTTSVRSYYLDYQDRVAAPAQRAPNGMSLLARVRVQGRNGEQSEWLPPLEFGYSTFSPGQQRFRPVRGSLPSTSLSDRTLEMVDLFGSGLQDILQMGETVRFWRNQGDGSFALPQDMSEAPAGLRLSDAGVQILDANGDGRADLLVTTPLMSGYYPLQFGGGWNRRSFQRYEKAPSFDLKDPEVRMVDLDGDGVTDALRSSTEIECFFNDASKGWVSEKRVARQSLELFPDVMFSDPRVKFGDMTGDGLQDIVFMHQNRIDYWPAKGRGSWGKRITMSADDSLRFPFRYDPRRIILSDVDGDGIADLIFVEDGRVTIWINQQGNGWGPAIEIRGTPSLSSADAIRSVDLLGNGMGGLLWTSDDAGNGSPHYFFLDFTGGIKPYLLNHVDNHTGSTTDITYRSSVGFYLEDQRIPTRRWVTPLPFPVQVVSQLKTTDIFSGSLTSEYSYHHGYWDGFEREFRGFGRVDQRDTQAFIVPHYTPPTELRSWFHQGNIGDPYSGWRESDVAGGFRGEYYPEAWPGVPAGVPVLARPPSVAATLSGMAPSVRRDAFRSLRGKVLRTELYALDGSARQDRPYTVTESVYGIRRESSAPSTSVAVFFPYGLSQRTTQWERGVDPLTVLTYTDAVDADGLPLNYDAFGQLIASITVAVPRGVNFQAAGGGMPYLATQNLTTFATAAANMPYLVDRPNSVVSQEILNDGNLSAQQLVRQVQQGLGNLRLIGHSVSFYDGDSYTGLPFGQLGLYGALIRTDSLVMTEQNLNEVYGIHRPGYITPGTAAHWGDEYPAEFRALTAPNAGYRYQAANPYFVGYYRTSDSCSYDFQTGAASIRGLVVSKRDPLGNTAQMRYDAFGLLVADVTDAAGLTTSASYDYRTFTPLVITDANHNQTQYSSSPLGLLVSISVMGKAGEAVGDAGAGPGDAPVPSMIFDYRFLDEGGTPVADLVPAQPVSVRTTRRVYHVNQPLLDETLRDQTIVKVDYSDGFGRLLQSRIQAPSVIYDDDADEVPLFGSAGLPADQALDLADAVGLEPRDGNPYVTVNGWQLRDNKGQSVVKYEPFFSSGWQYAPPTDVQLGQKSQLFYDPRGQLIRAVNPDASEQRIVMGVPGTLAAPDLSDPDVYEPTPWEIYTYDANDNGGRTHPATSTAHQWNTPASTMTDALGRAVRSVQRNRTLRADDTWSDIAELVTSSSFDIRGNLLQTTDALGRQAVSNAYDLANRALQTESLEGGAQIRIYDAVDSMLEQRDAKGAVILRAWDSVHRPIRTWAGDAEGSPMGLRQRTIFGDDAENSGLTADQAMAANLLGKPQVSFDEAGQLTFSGYDFKNNPLENTRRVFTDAALLAAFENPPVAWQLTPFRADWSPGAQTPLAATAYTVTLTYDALNRVLTMQHPQCVDGVRKTYRPSYNAAGALESLALDDTLYVERIAYDAKGQRRLLAYGNGHMTRYAYDPTSFRLARMRTERFAKTSEVTYHPSAPQAPLQELAYNYDLVGNIVAISEKTPGCGIPGSDLREDALVRLFVYDGLSRLVSATGRECDVPPAPPPWTDNPRCADLNRCRAYTESYHYDDAGNLAVWSHNGGALPTVRRFTLLAGNNRLQKVGVGAANYSYQYDPCGNVSAEATERGFEWDAANRLRVFRIQPQGAEPSVYAQYLCDASGNRVMKMVRTQGGRYEATVYVGTTFEHQRNVIVGGQIVANNSIHVMDSQQRIAIVRVGPAPPGDGAADVPIKYQFGDHLRSSNVVVDATGTWISREEFAPYGATSFGSYARKRYRFTGTERDEESGLSCHGARYYISWLGRWASCDPIGAHGGLNQYQYAASNPMCLSDRRGMAPDKEGTLQFLRNTGAFEAGKKSPPKVDGTAKENLRNAKEEASRFSTSAHAEGSKLGMQLRGELPSDIELPNNNGKPNFDAIDSIVPDPIYRGRSAKLIDYGNGPSGAQKGDKAPDWGLLKDGKDAALGQSGADYEGIADTKIANAKISERKYGGINRSARLLTVGDTVTERPRSSRGGGGKTGGFTDVPTCFSIFGGTLTVIAVISTARLLSAAYDESLKQNSHRPFEDELTRQAGAWGFSIAATAAFDLAVEGTFIGGTGGPLGAALGFVIGLSIGVAAGYLGGSVAGKYLEDPNHTGIISEFINLFSGPVW
jgi:RHS repeat-associated protein